MAACQAGEDLHLVEGECQVLGLHDPQRLLVHEQGFVQFALQHQALAKQRHLEVEVIPGGDLGGQSNALAQVGHRLVQGAAGQLGIAAHLIAPTRQLGVCRINAITRHFVGQLKVFGDTSAQVDDDGMHQLCAAAAMDVTGFAIGFCAERKVRLSLVPSAVVEIKKAQCVHGKRNRRRVVGLLRQHACTVVVAP